MQTPCRRHGKTQDITETSPIHHQNTTTKTRLPRSLPILMPLGHHQDITKTPTPQTPPRHHLGKNQHKSSKKAARDERKRPERNQQETSKRPARNRQEISKRPARDQQKTGKRSARDQQETSKKPARDQQERLGLRFGSLRNTSEIHGYSINRRISTR